MKYFVVSDVHNCYDALMAALDSDSFKWGEVSHKLLLLGDAFDKGAQPVETYEFLLNMLDLGQLIWIRGNHEIELVNAIRRRKLGRDSRATAVAIAKHLAGDETVTNHFDEQICDVLLKEGFDKWIEQNTVNFFELDGYVFVHGFIPLKNGKYDTAWRNADDKRWYGASKRCAVREVLKNDIRVKGKTIVSGHVGAYYGHAKLIRPDVWWDDEEFKKVAAAIVRKKPREYYETFYADGVIAIDANAHHTGFVNCIVVESSI